MLASVLSFGLHGLEAYPVFVEVDVTNGLPAFDLVGLPNTAVKESRERVRSAIKNAGLEFPMQRITVNLAPAHLRKEGPSFDLPIALGILAATRQLNPECLENCFWVGELSLDGQIRGVAGTLAMAWAVRDEIRNSGKNLSLVTPAENSAEAALIEEVKVFGVKHLAHLVADFQKSSGLTRCSSSGLFANAQSENPATGGVDFAQIKGQEVAKRALEVAAAGNHNLLMVGPPGTGKTLLVRAYPSILPTLTEQECIEVTRIYSVVAQMPKGQTFITQRPFRSPHHTSSAISLVGGGKNPQPGEVSLAHRGVLFLDEILEFGREALEALRQPIEDGQITISRLHTTMVFPSRFVLLGAMNPCPCGYFGDDLQPCICSPQQIKRYRQRLSGPMQDRFDLQIELPRLTYRELESAATGETSAQIQSRVEQARWKQRERLHTRGRENNAEMQLGEIEAFCTLDLAGKQFMQWVFEKFSLSIRAYNRILRVARTIADLAGSSTIKEEHLAETIQYRALDRPLNWE